MRRPPAATLGIAALVLGAVGAWALFAFGEYGFIGMWALIVAGTLGFLAFFLFGSTRGSG